MLVTEIKKNLRYKKLNEIYLDYEYAFSLYDNEMKDFDVFEGAKIDKNLIEKSGGIIQGMSGSPIVQNGKLIGAVTHVFLDDSTGGYGIFAETMLLKLDSIYNYTSYKFAS